MIKAFTLIELLISITIIFILVSFLATATSKAKTNGQRAACLNNARVLNMMVEEGMPVIFGNARDIRFIKKMRNYTPKRGRRISNSRKFEHP